MLRDVADVPYGENVTINKGPYFRAPGTYRGVAQGLILIDNGMSTIQVDPNGAFTVLDRAGNEIGFPDSTLPNDPPERE